MTNPQNAAGASSGLRTHHLRPNEPQSVVSGRTRRQAKTGQISRVSAPDAGFGPAPPRARVSLEPGSRHRGRLIRFGGRPLGLFGGSLGLALRLDRGLDLLVALRGDLLEAVDRVARPGRDQAPDDHVLL